MQAIIAVFYSLIAFSQAPSAKVEYLHQNGHLQRVVELKLENNILKCAVNSKVYLPKPTIKVKNLKAPFSDESPLIGCDVVVKWTQAGKSVRSCLKPEAGRLDSDIYQQCY